jgi:hypothetical protein
MKKIIEKFSIMEPGICFAVTPLKTVSFFACKTIETPG